MCSLGCTQLGLTTGPESAKALRDGQILKVNELPLSKKNYGFLSDIRESAEALITSATNRLIVLFKTVIGFVTRSSLVSAFGPMTLMLCCTALSAFHKHHKNDLQEHRYRNLLPHATTSGHIAMQIFH